MKSRWKWLSSVEPDREYLLLASSIPPKSRTSTWALFNGSRIVRRQLASTDGFVGFALLAEPIRMRYATLSVWRDEAALDAFAAAEPHRRLMAELAPRMGPTRFVTWNAVVGTGPPSWDDALTRLETPSTAGGAPP